MSDVKSFFEKHTHHHAYHREPSSYSQIVDSILRSFSNRSVNFLDLGCGDGSFIRCLNLSGIKGKFLGVDISHNMVTSASKELGNGLAELLVGDGFNLPLRPGTRFDLIHLDCVLHHLIGNNRHECTLLVKKLLALLFNILSNDGIIVIEEMYYVSFLSSELTSMIIFYGLRLMNRFGVDLSKLSSQFQPGLDVNFFSDKRLESIFKEFSTNINQIKKNQVKVPKLYKLFLLKDLGRISYVLYR